MRVRGHQFNVQTVGEGAPVIWSHGLMASIASEDKMGLLEWPGFPKSKRLIRYDALGHGRSEPSYNKLDYHWKSLARDLLAIAESKEALKFIVGGQSMGCGSALYTGLLAPERVEKMVLMNPPTCWEKRAAQSTFYNKMAIIGGLLGGNALAKVLSKHMDRLLPGWLLEARGAQVEGLLEGIRPLGRRTLFNLLRGVALTDFPPREKLRELEIPALILGWTDDPTHPVDVARELAELLPQSSLVVAEGIHDFEEWPGLIREFVRT